MRKSGRHPNHPGATTAIKTKAAPSPVICAAVLDSFSNQAVATRGAKPSSKAGSRIEKVQAKQQLRQADFGQQAAGDGEQAIVASDWKRRPRRRPAADRAAAGPPACAIAARRPLTPPSARSDSRTDLRSKAYKAAAGDRAEHVNDRGHDRERRAHAKTEKRHRHQLAVLDDENQDRGQKTTTMARYTQRMATPLRSSKARRVYSVAGPASQVGGVAGPTTSVPNYRPAARPAFALR